MIAIEDKDAKEASSLRLVPSPDERPAARPAPDLKPMLDDLKRRYRVMHERLEGTGDTPDAA